MRLRVSKGNIKVGKIPNLSLPPIITCVPNIKCAVEGCYALKSFKQYPNVRAAWSANLEYYEANPKEFFKEFDDWLEKHAPKRFRLFVGGDFPDKKFYRLFEQVAMNHYETKFLVFTKRYDYKFTNKPDNLQVVLSVWPGVPLPRNTKLPWAWLAGDFRGLGKKVVMCPGNCDDCGHQCWESLNEGIHVVFPKH